MSGCVILFSCLGALLVTSFSRTGVSDVVERKKAMDLLAELAATGVRLRVHRTVMKAYRNNAALAARR